MVPVPDLGFQILKLVAQQRYRVTGTGPHLERPETQMRDVGGDLATLKSAPTSVPSTGCLLLLCLWMNLNLS